MLYQERWITPRFSWNRLMVLFSALLLTAACAKEGSLPDETSSEPNSTLTDPAKDPATPVTQDPSSDPVTKNPAIPADPVDSSNPALTEEQILAKYDYLDPNHEIDTGLLKKAVLYFDGHQSSIANKNYLSVIDFSKKSTLKRFFIIDMKTGSVWGIHVAHGKGTDPEHDGYANPNLFSNQSGSNASSLGVYKTAETYSGEHGLSLRLDGLSSTNSNVRARAIVVHGADYVQESSVIQGRSWGCPAVAMENRDEVIRRLKGGSIIYAGLE